MPETVLHNSLPIQKTPHRFEKGNAIALLGGRPKGSVSPETKLKLKTEKVLKSFLYRSTKRLLHSQLVAAFGSYRIAVTKRDSEGKVNYEMVRDEKEIERLLLDGKHGEDYFIVAGADPDWRAADALLSRAYGKPKETLAVEPGAGFSLLALSQMRDGNADVRPADAPQLPEGTLEEKTHDT